MPKPKPKLPPAPRVLNADGKRVWNKFRMQTTDLETLEVYAISYQRLIQCSKDINKRGLTVLVESGRGVEMERPNPSCKLELDHARVCIMALRKLGLGDDAPEEEDELDKLGRK